MQCPKCGKENGPENLFCVGCGEKLSPAAPTPPGAAAKKPFLNRNMLILGGIILLLLIAVAVLGYRQFGGGRDEFAGGMESSEEAMSGGGEMEKSGKKTEGPQEYGRDIIRGTLVNTGKKLLVVKSLNTGKVYNIHTGFRTKYSPKRHPAIGETVKVQYFWERGHRAASHVVIE